MAATNRLRDDGRQTTDNDHLSVVRRPSSTAWLFWVVFWTLNWLIFAPIYLLQASEMAFWPDEFFLRARENLDIFRFNLEFGALVLLWLTLKPAMRPSPQPSPQGRGSFVLFPTGGGVGRRFSNGFLAGAFALYLLQLLYAVYEGFMLAFYQVAPNVYNDWPMFARGTEYTVASLSLHPAVYVGGLTLVLLAGGALFALHRLLFHPRLAANLGRGHTLALAVIILLALLAGNGNWARPEAAVSSFTAKLGNNIALSQATRHADNPFALWRIAPLYEMGGELIYKPNIHIIFIESYGSVLYKRPDFYAAYTGLLPGLRQQLEGGGWSVHTALSDAPTWGGGSWIAYTSFLFGLSLEEDADYRRLLAEYDRRPFPHLPNYLRGQGYRSYRLTSSINELDDAEWGQLVRFFGVDEWLRFGDVPYDGPLYGWGPSIPDQYVLNYGLERIKAETAAPYILFFITQNSHYPWYPLPEFAPDWRSLNETPAPDGGALSVPHEDLRRRYLLSIELELEMLVDLILNQGGTDDIFILIGDHQPSRVARYADGWDTPIHIISRDAAFTAAFEPFGFTPGMLVYPPEPTFHHAGFYSLFSRILLERYGREGSLLPTYRPFGANGE
jgi:hypothetical protein